MNLRTFLFSLVILAGGTAIAADPSIGDQFVATLTRVRPDVRWDRATWVEVAVRRVKEPDSAVLGYTGSQVVLAIGLAAKPEEILYLTLGIGGHAQDSLCGKTAKLSAEPLQCELDGGEKLPGCVSWPHAAELMIDDGDCDPFHVYWDHQQKHIAWWRN